MRLKSLSLRHFKNFQELEVSLPERGVLVVIGNNGQGKTNFLESIVILALSKSFQKHALKEMVNWYLHEEDTGLPELFHIAGEMTSQRGDHRLEVLCGKTRKYPKTLKIDDLKVKPKDYVGTLQIVLFTPQDLNMVMLAPQLRRRYVDILISQIDPEYLQHLSTYQQIVKQRNRLLTYIKEAKSSPDELLYWNQQLVEHGGYLLWNRREVFRALNQSLAQHYEAISSEHVELELRWKKEWDAASLDEMRSVYSSYLHDRQRRDIDAESTCGGPHREDFFLHMNGRDLSDFGSRGECRSAVLAMKLAELEHLKQLTGESPVVLFDDVFSELDTVRQKNLLQLFAADQVIITTTHLDEDFPDATVWTVDDGKILTTA